MSTKKASRRPKEQRKIAKPKYHTILILKAKELKRNATNMSNISLEVQHLLFCVTEHQPRGAA